MELCVLPETGADGGLWMIVAAVAAVVVVAGVVLLRSPASRRGALTGLAALAIVGALVLTSTGAATSASADAGSGSRACVTPTSAPSPSATPAPPAAVPVTPTFPTVAAQCGVDSVVTVPTQTGVDYAQTRDGNVVTVTATAQPGYVIPADVQSVFPYDVTPAPVAAAPVALPERLATVPSGRGGESAERVRPLDAALLPALVDAAAAGLLQYGLEAGAEATFRYSVVEPGTGTILDEGTFATPFQGTVVYVAETGELEITLLNRDEYFAGLDAARAALEEQYPDASVRTSFPDLGLTLVTSYEPGGACGTSVTVTPIDITEPAPTPPVLGDGGAPRDAPSFMPAD